MSSKTTLFWAIAPWWVMVACSHDTPDSASGTDTGTAVPLFSEPTGGTDTGPVSSGEDEGTADTSPPSDTATQTQDTDTASATDQDTADTSLPPDTSTQTQDTDTAPATDQDTADTSPPSDTATQTQDTDTGAVFLYPWPATAPTSDKYSATAYAGCTAYDLTVLYTAPNLTEGPDGNGVSWVKKRSLSYAKFAFAGRIEIEVTKEFGTPADRVEIQPKSYGIEPAYFDGRTVRFPIDASIDPAYISVHFVSDDNVDTGPTDHVSIKHAMMLFADPPETDAPDPTAPGVVDYTKASDRAQIEGADLLYFPPGEHRLKGKLPPVAGTGTDARIYLQRNGQRIYIAGGAIVHGSIDAGGKDHITISGRGIITGEQFYWHYFQKPTGGKVAFVNLMGSDDSAVHGIAIVNPTHHSLPMGKRAHIERVQIIGWASNHDGVRPSRDSVVTKVFLKTSDDLDYARDPHVFTDSVVWPMRNGAFGQLGWNNLGTGYAVYRNIRIINSEWDSVEKRNTGVIGSVLEQGVHLQGNAVENLYLEDFGAILTNITIAYEPGGDPLSGDSWGEVHHFVFRNIIAETPFVTTGGTRLRNPISGFERDGAKATVHDFEFINVVAGNTLVTDANKDQFFAIDPSTTADIHFSVQGPIYTVHTSATAGGTLRPGGDIPTPAGMDRAIAVVPDAGYRIAEVLVDGRSVGRRQNVFFPAIDTDHTVHVRFEPGADTFGAPSPCGR